MPFDPTDVLVWPGGAFPVLPVRFTTMTYVKISSRLTFVLALCGLCACAGGTQSWFDQHAAGKTTLAKRASFDLSCAEAQLTFTCLGSGSPQCNSVGVSGCAKKATYVFVNNHEWVMDSTQ